MPKRNSPGKCFCCGTQKQVCRFCVRTLGCANATSIGIPLAGASVTIAWPATPNTPLASGITNSDGEACFEVPNQPSVLGSHLQAQVGSVSNDYKATTFNHAFPWCDTTRTLFLTPGASPTGGGVAGTLTLNMRDCSGGTSGIVGKQIGLYQTAAPTTLLDSRTFTASGQVTFTSVPVGVSVFVGGLNFETFPSFTLTCAGIADARTTESGFCSQEWSFTSVPCGSAGVDKTCCVTCNPNTVPLLRWDDTAMPYATDTTTCGTIPCGGVMYLTDAGGGPLLEGNDPCWSPSTNTMGPSYRWWCTPAGIKLRRSYAYPCTTRASIFSPICRYCGTRTAGTCGQPACNGAPGDALVDEVFASSYTCDPFTATFSIPSRQIQLGYPIACRGTLLDYVICETRTMPAATVTLVEA